jgi:tRNA isopentenyl-2-thiomethyl-A-37 hydroxylase MiaE
MVIYIALAKSIGPTIPGVAMYVGNWKRYVWIKKKEQSKLTDSLIVGGWLNGRSCLAD